ncbi:MAG TPA: prepilin-type N-terminal cleavage/methylation domain-containing protein [Terriglobales bacterium]|nr:prepilin-type N-terminal cleavage/methylation domain-containing protein [Terriglobales bacterium]
MKAELGCRQHGATDSVRTSLRARRVRQKGFTLIELMIVVSILLILISMAVPIYNQSIIRAREAVLHNNLFTMRSLINQYTMDKEKAPQSLEDLVSAGYLKQIPIDPFTGSRDTWVVEQEDVLMSVDQTQPGITDVHSGSDAMSSEGTPYSSW